MASRIIESISGVKIDTGIWHKPSNKTSIIGKIFRTDIFRNPFGGHFMETRFAFKADLERKPANQDKPMEQGKLYIMKVEPLAENPNMGQMRMFEVSAGK